MVAHGSRGIPESSGPRTAVEVLTLGRFEVIGPEAGAETATSRPLTLLKLLIALGGRAVAAAQVSDALWPDADGYAAHRALITNLQRLRRVIGRASVVLQGACLSLDPAECRVDALRLPRHLDGMVAASEPRSMLRHASAALDLYRGRFLPGDFDPPEIISTRTRLHSRIVSSIVAASERLIGHGSIDDAIELLRRALAIDDRSETLHRSLMRAFARSARWADGIEAYGHCCEALREFYGVTPSSETAQLYRTFLERGGVATGRDTSALVAAGAAHEEQRRITAALVALAATPSPPGPCKDSAGADLRCNARRRIEETVARYGGAVHDSDGRLVLAVFGAPIAHEDDAERAVRACWALVHDAACTTPAGDGAGSLSTTCCAIQSGIVVARPARSGTGMRLDGKPLQEVRHLLTLAGPAQVVVDHATRSSVADYFQCRPAHGADTANSPVAYYIIGETGIDSHFAASKARGLAPFLGRRDELARLRRGLQRAHAGEGSMAAISGEPGIGKSRLMHEFAVAVEPRETRVVEAGCRAYGERTPYAPFIQAVRALLELDATAPTSYQARYVPERLRAIEPGLVPYAPYCQRLLSLPVTGNGDAARPATGAALRRLTKEAIGALIVQATRARSLLLVLEDWHWSDESSDEVLRYLQGLVLSHRVLIVLTHRSASPPSGLSDVPLDFVRLGPLADDDSIDLARYVLGTASVPERLARLVHTRAGGNPFFIEEICNGLRPDAGSEAPVGPPPRDIAIPETVQGMIRNRLDDIDRGARDAALSAAVIGRDFSLRLLLEVHDNRQALEDDLERLKAREIIHQSGVLPEVEYRFKHALTQVVAYDALSPGRKRTLHNRAGRAIERLYAGRLEEHVESLARHFTAAADADRAVKYLEQAGDKAARAYATAAAVGHYRQAIELLDASAQTQQTLRRRIDLSCKWADVTHYVSAHESLKVLGRALTFAKRIADPAREARVLYWIGRMHHVMGNPTDALPCFRRALARMPSEQSGEIAPLAHACTGRALLMIGDLPRSVRALELALTDLDPVRDPEETCYSTSFLALALAHQGEFERSLALQERALRLARAAGDRTYEASALVRLAVSWVVKGDWQAAIDAARDTVGIAERGENPMIAGFAVFLEGQARFMLGDTAAGLAQCNRGLQIVEQSGSHLGFSLFLSALAELHALAGDHDRAIEIAGRALAQRRSGGHLGLYDAYRALALVAEHRAPGNLRLARSRLAYAHRLATAAGAWPAVAVGCLRQAEMLARHGKPDRARVALRKAIVYFESRGMRWWLDQAKRQDAELHARRDSSLAIPVTGLLPPRV